MLYIDFQRNAAQWTERYSIPSPIPGKLPIKCKFKFDRAAIDWNLIDPAKFNRNPLEFALHSIRYKIEKSKAKVVIIDDITLGGVALLRPTNATARIVQTLKFWSATQNLSILILAGVSPRVSSPHDSKGLRKNSRLPSPVSRLLSSFTVADSIFSLNHSTFGPQYRYVKSLKQSAISDQHPAEVSAYELISSTPHLPIFLKDLGTSSESDHLRDYQKEAERVSSPHVSKGLTAESDRAKRLRRLSRESAVSILMSKEYWRYLGE